MTMQTIEFDHFEGVKRLTRIWFGTKGGANHIGMVLDKCSYQFEEDPEDGYRSSLRHIMMGVPVPRSSTRIPALPIVFSREGEHLIEGHCAESGLLVLKVGTASYESYYPYFLAEWTPENLAVNRGPMRGEICPS